jgi:hypothetical protein
LIRRGVPTKFAIVLPMSCITNRAQQRPSKH